MARSRKSEEGGHGDPSSSGRGSVTASLGLRVPQVAAGPRQVQKRGRGAGWPRQEHVGKRGGAPRPPMKTSGLRTMTGRRRDPTARLRRSPGRGKVCSGIRCEKERVRWGEGGREASLFQGRPTGHLCKRGRRRQRDEGRLTRFDPLYWTSLSSETREPSAWSPASAGCGTMGVTLLTKELREQNTQTKALSAVTRAMRERIEGKQY